MDDRDFLLNARYGVLNAERKEKALQFARDNPGASWDECRRFAAGAIPGIDADPATPIGGGVACPTEKEATLPFMEKVLEYMRYGMTFTEAITNARFMTPSADDGQ